MITSKTAWMSRTLAPWCAAGLLLVSFTADAGQESAYGASRSVLSARAALAPEELIPARRALVEEARLIVGDDSDLAARPDEITPRLDIKPHLGPDPSIDRSAKSDPFVALRPTFDTQLRRSGGLEAARASALFYAVDDALPVSAFEEIDGDASGPGSVDAFVTPSERAEPGLSRFKIHGRSRSEAFQSGATPALPRAVTLAATTPSPPDVTPVTISLVALSAAKNVTVAERAPDQPDFAALISPASAKDEEHCLAQAIYFEARSEPEEGMAAVAQVVLNRVKSGLYADSVCGVVFQNSQRYKACQFSFTCEGKSLRVTELDLWQTALRVAREVTEGKTWIADVGASTHYHANYVHPDWASRLKRMDKIGHHIFYRQRDG